MIQDTQDAQRIWFLDSGCPNHMTSKKELFKELDETYKVKVRLADDKLIQVEGKGTATLTNNGVDNYLHNVYFVSNLSQNLLSVGQLVNSGYSILFADSLCTIKEKNTGEIVARICMSPNKLFPLEESAIKHHALTVQEQKDESRLWHLRYGHLNIRGLKLLS